MCIRDRCRAARRRAERSAALKTSQFVFYERQDGHGTTHYRGLCQKTDLEYQTSQPPQQGNDREAVGRGGYDSELRK